MTPYLKDADVTLYHGDALAVLRELTAESVDCCVTSPPYWGLRDYGTGAWEGGDEGCDHQAAAPSQEGDDGKRRADEYLQDRGGNRHNRGEGGPVQHGGWEGRATRSDGSRVCKCGATRTDQQLGLESTPEEYVARMVEVFREVRRVLAGHGTVWLNLGSSYNVGTNADRKPTTTTGSDVPSSWKSRSQPTRRAASGDTRPNRSRPDAPAYGSDDRGRADSSGLDSACRDLCDECLADFLSHRDRTSDTSQPASLDEPQPSTTDRDSAQQDSASTSPDASPLDARESTTLQSWLRLRGSCSRCDSRASSLSAARSSVDDVPASGHMPWLNYTSRLKPKDMVPTPWMVAMALQQDGWYLRADIIWAKPNPMPESVTDRPTKAHEYVFLLSKQPRYFFDQEAVREAEGSGRNIRTVWEIATQPYPEAHFATFPEELARRCIAAGCPESVCRVCGKPWERETASERTDSRPGISVKLRQIGRGNAARTGRAGDYNRETLGLQPSCECGKIREAAAGGCITTSTLGEASGEGNDPGTSAAAGIILDPFVGSGTTCFVARKLGRRSIGIDLSADYLALAARRLQQQSLYALDTGAETPLGSERTE